MKTVRSQRGMTVWGLLVLIGCGGFVAITFIKLAPVYIEHFKVSTAVNSLTTDVRAEGVSGLELRELLLKKLDIDNVHQVKHSDIKIARDEGDVVLWVEYETRLHWVGNIDLVVKFSSGRVILKG